MATSQQTTQPGLLFSRLKGSCSPVLQSLLVRKRQASTAPAASCPILFHSLVPGMGLSEGKPLHLRVGTRCRLKETKGLREGRALTGSVWPKICSQFLSSLRKNRPPPPPNSLILRPNFCLLCEAHEGSWLCAGYPRKKKSHLRREQNADSRSSAPLHRSERGRAGVREQV